MVRAIVLISVFLVAGCGVGVDGMGNDASGAPVAEQSPSAKRSSGGSGGSTTQVSASPLHATAGAMSASTSDWQSSFVISSTSAVNFALDVSHKLRGSHVLTLYVFMPDGYSYTSYAVPFATTTTAGPGEQQAELLPSGDYRVWVSLPVAGTTIDDRQLTGAWNADAYLDSSGTADATAPFTLE